MAFASLTYTLTNGSEADADQVQQNFNDLLNGMSDTTKDISIAAITAGGTATFNGSVNIGNSISDDLIITASLASTLPIKTTNSYDIGTTTLGLRGLFFGANSQTTKIVGNPSMAATYTLTLPTNVATADDYVVRGTTAGVLSFQKPGPITATGADANTTLTVTSSRHQKITPTANREYTLPTTSVVAGDIFYFSNSAAVDTNSWLVTVKSSNGSTMRTVYPQTTAAVMALQDTPTTPTHWISLEQVTSNWTAYTPTFGGTAGATSVDFRWCRRGENIEIHGYLTFSGATSGNFSATTPTGVTLDSGPYDLGSAAPIGSAMFFQGGNAYTGPATYSSTTTISCFTGYNQTASGGFRVGLQVNGSAGDQLEVHAVVKVSGWEDRRG